MVLIDVYIIFHSKATEYIYLSIAHGTFSRIDHIIDHKTSLINSRRLNYIKHLQQKWYEIRNQSQEKTQKCEY